jgi:predicted acyltransferase
MLIKLLFNGGIFFTGPILILFISSIILLIQSIRLVKQKQAIAKKIQWINSLGLFALVFGILGQLLGLMEGLQAIEFAGSVSSSILAGGLFTSSIPTLFGLITFLVSRLATMYLSWLENKHQISSNQLQEHVS